MKTPHLPDSPRLCQNPDCNKHLTGRADKTTCSDKCRNALKNAKRKTTLTKTCIVCNTQFSSSHKQVVTCSERCKAKRENDIAQEHQKAMYEFVQITRREFIELTSDDEREMYADNLIEEFCSDYKVRQAFNRYLSVPFEPKIKYNPLKNGKLSRKNVLGRYVVALHDVYDLEANTVEHVVDIFYDGLPRLNFPTFAGSFVTKDYALSQKQELETILSYEDERTQLLLDYRVIQHNLEEAALFLEEVKRNIDAFVYAESRCRVLYEQSLDSYYKQRQEVERSIIGN